MKTVQSPHICHLHHLRNFNNHPNILKPSQLSKHSNKLLHVNLDLPGISEHLQENILENARGRISSNFI